MKKEIRSAIDSTKQMINDKIDQLGIDFILSNISENCCFCPSDATGVIAQEIPLKEAIIGMYFSVCDSCGTQENSTKIFNELIKHTFSFSKSTITENLSENELQQKAFELFNSKLNFEDLHMKKKNGGFEITGLRKSGLRIIFRYEGMNNFAYVFTLNGIEKFT